MVREAGRHHPPPLRAQNQIGPVLGVWNCGFDSLAVVECALVLSEVREVVVGIGMVSLLDVRYVVTGYQRRWRVGVPPTLLE